MPIPYYDVEPCLDCIEIHGDTRSDWLRDWPEGAEYRSDFHCHLCDGCHDERLAHHQAASELQP